MMGVALDCGLDDWGFKSWQRLEIFLSTTQSRPALGPPSLPSSGLPGALSLGVKWLGHEAHHSPPSSAKVENVWIYTFTPPIHLRGMVLS
jgi:hypothetical protein